ncbi:MAG: fibronectin type III domain-containing protein [Eubacterium sp.]
MSKDSEKTYIFCITYPNFDFSSYYAILKLPLFTKGGTIMKRTKFLLSTIIISLLLSNGVKVNASTIWEHYFGIDEKCNSVWYEGAECDGEPKTSDDGWTAKLKSIGWGGIWGAQISTKDIPYIVMGQKYQLKCKLMSTNCDKWVFIKISTGNLYAYGKWIRLIRNQLTTIDETFIAATNANQITFGFGGEFGDRESTDGIVHYSFAYGGQAVIALNSDRDAKYATTVSCSDFYLGPVIGKTSLSKVKRTSKKAQITLKKVSNAHGYQIQYSTTKKFKAKKTKTITTKKTTYTIKKLKKSTKYYVRARAYKKVSGKKVYGNWSKTKTILKK